MVVELFVIFKPYRHRFGRISTFFNKKSSLNLTKLIQTWLPTKT